MAAQIVQLILNIGIPALLLAVGLVGGGVIAAMHRRHLQLSERRLAHFHVTNLRRITGSDLLGTPVLVVGEVTLSTDYLTSFLAGLKNLLGGELRNYRELAMRARREALVRMLEEADRQGCDCVCNVRVEFADISGSAEGRRRKTAMITILASGTAYRRQEGAGNAAAPR